MSTAFIGCSAKNESLSSTQSISMDDSIEVDCRIETRHDDELSNHYIYDDKILEEKVDSNITYNSKGLPLYQSNPRSHYVLFLDFDGGYYGSEREFYKGASLDGDLSTFNKSEQLRIIDASKNVANAFKDFNVNVTTDENILKSPKTKKWHWILITNDVGRSGKGKTSYNPRFKGARAIAGTQSVLNPKIHEANSYLLVHELGHTFTLHHAGRRQGGRFQEYSDYAKGSQGAFMGGRASRFRSYKWKNLVTEKKDQNSYKIIAGFTGNAQQSPIPSPPKPPSPSPLPPPQGDPQDNNKNKCKRLRHPDRIRKCIENL